MRWLLLPLALVLFAAQSPPAPVEAKVRFIQIRPKGPGPFPAVVMLHGDFGLNAWTRQQARRLADKGYLVLAVDLYHGELPRDVEEAHILERGLPAERVQADVKAAIDHLAGHADVARDAIGILGWDCGGGYALDAAIRDRRLKTAVVCYGRVTTDPKRLAALEGSVLALFGGQDEGIAPATIERFRKAMKQAGKSATIHVYPKCGNGFMDPDSPYADGPPDRAAIADAWTKIEANLEARLKK